MFASYMETVSADAEVSEPTDGGTKNAPESRVEPNLRRVKLNIGHLGVQPTERSCTAPHTRARVVCRRTLSDEKREGVWTAQLHAWLQRTTSRERARSHRRLRTKSHSSEISRFVLRYVLTRLNWPDLLTVSP